MVRSNFWTVDSEDRETTKRNWKRFGSSRQLLDSGFGGSGCKQELECDSAKFRGQQLLLEDRDNKKEWETISQPENSSCRVFVLRSALGAKFTKKTLHSVISSRLRTKINPKGEKEISKMPRTSQ
ncbi:hypothetical protein L3Y34_014376 [Caenorhabditis briggsae]|uniref:Uncharacterized protein n=1 Tax=Caenorhabditis briggsae TaxID=6238 RepID=A0AAE9DSU8_CAEBR|nr:hypothetical protein L3Y34_014376 [Caenorhabditis briggsae]